MTYLLYSSMITTQTRKFPDVAEDVDVVAEGVAVVTSSTITISTTRTISTTITMVATVVVVTIMSGLHQITSQSNLSSCQLGPQSSLQARACLMAREVSPWAGASHKPYLRVCALLVRHDPVVRVRCFCVDICKCGGRTSAQSCFF
jgi:hypothetical protein